MSDTTIVTTKVVAVLLADGWHRVVQGSFSVGALNFGAGADPGVLGFSFEAADVGNPYRPAALAGPLSSVLAVRQAASARQARELGHPAPRRWVHPAAEAVA
jgi:hypothetical protein